MFELNKKNMKKLALLIAFAIILFLGLQNITVVLNILGFVIKLLMPFILGVCIAFILNIPLKFIEKLMTRKKKNSKKRKVTKLMRATSITLSLLLFIGIVFMILFLVIPELINTFNIFKENIPTVFNDAKDWLEEMTSNYPDIKAKIQEFTPNWEDINNAISNFVKNGLTDVLSSSVNFIISIFTSIVNFIMGLIFAIYMLFQKEKLVGQIKKVIYAYITKKRADKLIRIGTISNITFNKFMGGQFIEAIILGTLCFIGMSIFRIPYSLTVSVLVGFTALIPAFGAFIGTGIGVLLIVVVSPVKAFWFVVFIIILQQIEGNLIYPKVVGKSVGLPAMWVMFAVILGGSLMGLLGMIISVPISSILYALFREAVNDRLKIKEEQEKTKIEEIEEQNIKESR